MPEVGGQRHRHRRAAIADAGRHGEVHALLLCTRGGHRVIGQLALAVADLADQHRARRRPAQPARRDLDAGREVDQRATGGGHRVDVAAGGALVAHQAADEGDPRGIRRPARQRDLQPVQRAAGGVGRIDQHGGGGIDLCGLHVEPGDPPVVVARRRRGGIGDVRAVRRPVELVGVHAGGRQLMQRAAGDVEAGHALHLDAADADLAGGPLGRGHRAGVAGGACDIEEAERLAVVGPLQRAHVAFQRGQPRRCGAAAGVGQVDVVLHHPGAGEVDVAVGDEGEVARVRRPRDAGFGAAARCGRRTHAARMAAVGVGHLDRRLVVAPDHPGELPAVRRDRGGLDRLRLAQFGQHLLDARVHRGRVGEGVGRQRQAQQRKGSDQVRALGHERFRPGESVKPTTRCGVRQVGKARAACPVPGPDWRIARGARRGWRKIRAGPTSPHRPWQGRERRRQACAPSASRW